MKLEQVRATELKKRRPPIRSLYFKNFREMPISSGKEEAPGHSLMTDKNPLYYLLGGTAILGVVFLCLLLGGPTPQTTEIQAVDSWEGVGQCIGLSDEELRKMQPPASWGGPLFIDSISLPSATLKGDIPPIPPCLEGVRVECQTPPYIPMYFPTECLIRLPPEFCVGPQGTNHSPDWWIRHFTEQGNESKDVIKCISACAGLHEAIHARDFSQNPQIRMCLTEVNAFQASRECLKGCDRRHCFLSPPDIFQNEISPCRVLSRNLRLQDAAVDMNRCICNRLEEPCGKEDPLCVQCRESCENNHRPEFCDVLSPLYCRPMFPPPPAAPAEVLPEPAP